MQNDMIMSALNSGVMDAAAKNLNNGEMVETSASTLENIVGSQVPEYYIPKARQQKREFRKIGRNEMCPCGSQRKYKNCCLNSGKYEGYVDA